MRTTIFKFCWWVMVVTNFLAWGVTFDYLADHGLLASLQSELLRYAFIQAFLSMFLLTAYARLWLHDEQ